MTAPYFTSNDADLTQLEGLYIQERNPPALVSGVSLNIVGIVGECVRGPVNEAILITSAGRFREVFGGRDHTADGTGGTRVGQVHLTLANKPFGAVYVVRAAAAAAVAASFTLESAAGGGGTAIARVDASSVGTWGNNVGVKVSAATNGDANYWNLTVRYLGSTYLFENLLTTTGNDNTATVVGTDDGTLITITKLASGRPVNNAASTDGADADGYVLLGQTVGSYTSVAGTDGTIADSDFTGTGKGLEIHAAQSGVAVVMVAERMSTTIKDKCETLAATAVDRMFLIGADAETTSVSAAATDAALQRSDRLIYCYNHPYTRDPDTATEVLTRPESWMASILSQTDVDIHPGEEDTKRFTAGITRLYQNALQRADYTALKAAGIAALEYDEGFAFVSGVTTSLTSGKTEITRRRMTDYIQLSLARELRYSVKKKNTVSRRKANAAMIQAFLNDLMKSERIVEDFAVDTEQLNTPSQRAQGVEKILLRVKLLGHILHLALVTEIGTSVSISEAA
jgi:hypothetical protein